jgi:polysaccharide pyruvyl transferase WcaK-like protein
MRADARRPRIATVGFQGFGNVGDEAILSGIEELLGDESGRVVIVFAGPAVDSVSAFPAARRVVTWRHLPTLAALRALRRVDRLVLAGGGLFNDHWATVIPRYLAWTVAARLAGASVAWASVGVGPIRRPWLRWMLRRGARLVEMITVRDDGSARILGRSVRSSVVPDPSLFNPAPLERDRDGIGLIVRSPTASQAEEEPRLLGAFVDVIGHLTADGRRVHVLSMGGGADTQLLAKLENALAGHDRASVDRLGPSPLDALERIAALEGVLTLRLHGLLLSALAGVPAVPIAYDAKVDAAAERLGLGDLVVPIAEATPDRLLAALGVAGEDGRRRAVAEAVARLRADRSALRAAILGNGTA